MRVFRSIEQARGQIAGAALAIGNFDGVHLGHQALLAATLEASKRRGTPAAALTFEPHPGRFLSPKVAPRLLTTPGRKLELLQEAGLDAVVVQPFDRAFAAIPARDFVDRLLVADLGVGDVAVGEDFTFGRGRAGRVADLEAWLKLGGARLVVVPKIRCEGVPVSSTRIRELVLEGRVEAAAPLLGRPFDVDGTVVAGMGRGRTLGFPTANVQPDSELLPPNGVYAVTGRCPAGEFPGAANLGRKPTFGEGAPQSLEVHLVGYGGPSLLGTRMRVAFVARLRDELRFPSVEALVGQIRADVETAVALVARPHP